MPCASRVEGVMETAWITYIEFADDWGKRSRG